MPPENLLRKEREGGHHWDAGYKLNPFNRRWQRPRHYAISRRSRSWMSMTAHIAAHVTWCKGCSPWLASKWQLVHTASIWPTASKAIFVAQTAYFTCKQGRRGGRREDRREERRTTPYFEWWSREWDGWIQNFLLSDPSFSFNIPSVCVLLFKCVFSVCLVCKVCAVCLVCLPACYALFVSSHCLCLVMWLAHSKQDVQQPVATALINRMLMITT